MAESASPLGCHVKVCQPRDRLDDDNDGDSALYSRHLWVQAMFEFWMVQHCVLSVCVCVCVFLFLCVCVCVCVCVCALCRHSPRCSLCSDLWFKLMLKNVLFPFLKQDGTGSIAGLASLLVEPHEFQEAFIFCYLVLPGLFVIAHVCADANCPDVRTCRDWYSGRVLYRRCVNLTEVPWDIPTDALAVNLVCNSISSLPVRIFSRLTQCLYLYLDNNQISSVHKEAFTGMRSLQILNLQHNRIPLIETGTFDELSSLATLNLWGNQLSGIPVGIFTSLNNLVELYLHQNNISNIAIGAFARMQSLKKLYLWGNQLTSIHAGMFQNLNNLLNLQLSQNWISTIESGAFDVLTSLKILYLWGNQLSSIADGTFRNLYKLETLLLNENQISQIQNESFDSLSSLKILDLSNNRLTTLSPDLLINLPRSPTLQLGLSDDKINQHNTRNIWNCSSMCWLKYEVQRGTIGWWISPNTQRTRSPSCNCRVNEQVSWQVAK